MFTHGIFQSFKSLSTVISLFSGDQCVGSCVTGKKRGKIAVIGSGHMFSDKYLGSERNNKFSDIIFDFLTGDSIMLNTLDADDPEVRIFFFRRWVRSLEVTKILNFLFFS